MDLSRGRLEGVGETHPIVEGWVTTVHPERRQPKASAGLPFPERRRQGKRNATSPRPGAVWVAIGHFTVRATEDQHNISLENVKQYLVANGIRFEIVYLKPVYVDSRNHKYIYSASKTQRYTFVALFTPTPVQLRLLPVTQPQADVGNKPRNRMEISMKGSKPPAGTPTPPPKTPTPAAPSTPVKLSADPALTDFLSELVGDETQLVNSGPDLDGDET
jgi:hypothetical protein